MSKRRFAIIGCLGFLVILFGTPFYFSYQQKSIFSSIGSGLPGGFPPQASPLDAIDKLLASLPLANIAFNTPSTIPLGESEIIHLVLSTRETMETLQTMIESGGEKTGAQIKVGNAMEARLTGKGFKIQAITPETQAVSGVEKTEWKWEVEPAEGGKQRLHLTMAAILHIDGQKVPRVLRTFERSIEVQVTWSRQISDFVGNNWQWLWATILVPVAGWYVQRKYGAPHSETTPGEGDDQKFGPTT